MYDSTTLIDLMQEILEEYQEDEDIDQGTLEDLAETIEMVLYERRSFTSEMVISINDQDA